MPIFTIFWYECHLQNGSYNVWNEFYFVHTFDIKHTILPVNGLQTWPIYYYKRAQHCKQLEYK